MAALLVATGMSPIRAAESNAATVGMPQKWLQQIVPGPLLQPKPIVRGQPVVVRIVAAYPHGDAYRYDFEYTLFEPGRFDLRDYLQREDGSALDGVAPLPVAAKTMLAEGQILPNDVPPGPLPGWGGYRAVLITAGVAWGLGFLYLVLPRRTRRVGPDTADENKPLEVRLREAIQGAQRNELTAAEMAELERMVLAHWRQRLGLAHLPAAEALGELRRHEQARVALDLLEQWLHHPQGRKVEDFSQLLDPVVEDLRVPRL